MSEQSDRALVELARRGDGAAIGELFNDAGQIAGTCYFGGDAAHACLLSPVTPNP